MAGFDKDQRDVKPGLRILASLGLIWDRCRTVQFQSLRDDESRTFQRRRSWRRARVTFLAALIALGGTLTAPIPAAVASVTIFGRNLIANGDAEAGAGSPDGSVVPVPGWATSGNFTVVEYGAEGVPSFTDPGPPDRGLNFFAGGPNNASSSAWQLINVSSATHQIDSGAVTFALAGYLGGFADQGDNAVLSITFKKGDLALGAA